MAGTKAATQVKTSSTGQGSGPRRASSGITQILGALAGLAMLVIVLSIISPQFATRDNILNNIAQQVVINCILASAMTLVIITGGIDLSVGSIAALASMVTVGLMVGRSGRLPMWEAIPIGLGAGALAGFISGLLITWLRNPPFIATLAMMLGARGLANAYTSGATLYGVPSGFESLSRYITLPLIGRIPFPAILAGLVALCCGILLSKSCFGRHIYAIGGNEPAARLSGIPINRVKIQVYTLCGLLSAFAGIILASWLSSAGPQVGDGYELKAIAAAVIGGTSLSGGKGNLFGTLIGVLIIGCITNGMNLLLVPPGYQDVVLGAVIAIMVTIDQFRFRKER